MSGGTWQGVIQGACMTVLDFDCTGSFKMFLDSLEHKNIPLFATIHRQDLNVSFLKGQKYKLQNSVAKISNEVHVSLILPNTIMEAAHSFHNTQFDI